MSWIIAGTAIGTAVLGAAQGAQKRKSEQAQNQASADMSAAQMQYSPWTKITPQAYQPNAPDSSAFGGAVQGGLGGAMFGQSLKKQNMHEEALELEKLRAGQNLTARGGLPPG